MKKMHTNIFQTTKNVDLVLKFYQFCEIIENIIITLVLLIFIFMNENKKMRLGGLMALQRCFRLF